MFYRKRLVRRFIYGRFMIAVIFIIFRRLYDGEFFSEEMGKIGREVLSYF